MFLAMKLAETDIPVHRRERKLRGTIPYFCWHASSLLGLQVVRRACAPQAAQPRCSTSHRQYSIPTLLRQLDGREVFVFMRNNEY
jgi:hypothetical protein